MMLSLQMFKSPCLVANGLKVFWTLHKTPSLSSTLGTQPTKNIRKYTYYHYMYKKGCMIQQSFTFT